jgi:hypothetical protein
MSRLRKRISILQPRPCGSCARTSHRRGYSAKDLSDGLYQEIRNPPQADLKSRFVKSRRFIGRGQLLVFVDVSFGGKGKMKGLAKSGKRMSP